MKLTFLDLGDGGDLLPGFLWDVVWLFLGFPINYVTHNPTSWGWEFQDRKRIFGWKYISCQLPAVAFNFLSWRSGNPLKQMLGNKCSFLSSVLFGTFYLLDCFVWSKHLLAWKVSLFLCLIPLSEIFSDLPRLICFECDPPLPLHQPWHKGWSIYQKEVRDQNRYRPNRAAEEMRPKQGHFKVVAKNILKFCQKHI